MNIAYVMTAGRGDTDLLLADLAGRLSARGVRACGTVQINSEPPACGPCDMDVKVLPDGPVVRISQSLGKQARGCRLDAAALETAVGHATAALDAGADVLLVNKFGKREAEGGGFREVIAEALSRGIPTLVGLSALNAEAFHAFTGGEATRLAPRIDVLLDWLGSKTPSLAAGAHRPIGEQPSQVGSAS